MTPEEKIRVERIIREQKLSLEVPLSFEVECEGCGRKTHITASNTIGLPMIHCTLCGSYDFKRKPL